MHHDNNSPAKPVYRKLLKEGMPVHQAAWCAGILLRWNILTDMGEVRLRWQMDSDYRALFMDNLTDDERTGLVEAARKHGVYGLIGEYLDPTTDVWIEGDAAYGFIGRDAHWYEYSIMATTMVAKGEPVDRPLFTDDSFPL